MAFNGEWRVHRGLAVLRDELKSANPGMVIGTIADDEHSTTSDHYPHYIPGDPVAVVRALDPMIGRAYTAAEADRDVELIRSRRDPRVKYVIWKRRIFSGNAGPKPFLWRPYNQSDPHTNHWHISAVNSEADRSLWLLRRTRVMETFQVRMPVLQYGDNDAEVDGYDMVRRVQKIVGVDVDGDYGPATAEGIARECGGNGRRVAEDEWRTLFGLSR